MLLLSWCYGLKSEVSVPHSTVHGLSSEVAVGAKQSFTVIARNSHGEAVTHGGSVWSIRFIGPVYASPKCISDEGDGRYVVTFVLPQPGTYKMQLELKYEYINTTSSSVCTRQSVYRMYTACNPKSEFYVNMEGLRGCDDLDSNDCLVSTKNYIMCMERVKNLCNYPSLIKERWPRELELNAFGTSRLLTPSSRPCSNRSEVLGAGYWVNSTESCAVNNAWKFLGFSNEASCRDSIFPCSSPNRDKLSDTICKSELLWRPLKCHAIPVTQELLDNSRRHIYFYGVSTMDEIARRMRDFFSTDLITSNRNIRNWAEIPWRRKNTTFFLGSCGELVATTLTLTLYDKPRHESCHVFAQTLHKMNMRHSHNGFIDAIYQRHPVNYPRNAHSPSEIRNAIGRYPGSRGYMSTDEILTDFYYDIMSIFTHEKAPLAGILDQQGMTESLWPTYGDGLHFDNNVTRFVLDNCVLLLANSVILPRHVALPKRHDPTIGSCPSPFNVHTVH